MDSGSGYSVQPDFFACECPEWAVERSPFIQPFLRA